MAAFEKGETAQKRMCTLSRRTHVIQHLVAAEAASHMRELGDVIMTEPKKAAELMRKVKETTFWEDEGPNSKKRFGRSIGRRRPVPFQQKVREKFEQTGRKYTEVPPMHRASQYNYTSG